MITMMVKSISLPVATVYLYYDNQYEIDITLVILFLIITDIILLPLIIQISYLSCNKRNVEALVQILFCCNLCKSTVEPDTVENYDSTLYILVLKSFWFKKPFWEHACYRIMFFLGIPDILSLIVCAEFAGIWSLLGLHSCYDMEFSIISGCLVFGTWHMSCFYVLILAFNRSCELVAPNISRLIFNGKPLKLVLCLPISYFVYFTFFTKPLIYNVHESAFMLNPLTKATMNFYPELFTVYGFIINNFFVIFFIAVNYSTICIYLLYHSCSTSIQKVSKVYRQITVQCLVTDAKCLPYNCTVSMDWKPWSPSSGLHYFQFLHSVENHIL
ncbi:hypothetical protein L3Y34_002883 [Caenorhabditis briggsae]|uniref:Uncharacterized protein n=1 Tax=Caenorhabditis briggsae TaxID=6238 RepID=A0AAE9AEJ9_CAEBR|nr:hypothetical protein L3Y34_002883 [Caenorhabditis briggsae]